MLLIISTLLAAGFARADSRIEAVTGHVITQKIQNNDMDHSAVANAELNQTNAPVKFRDTCCCV